MKRKIALTEIEKNSNIGLYGVVCDKFAIFGKNVDVKIIEKVKKIIDVEIYQTTIFNSDLVGIFMCLSNDYLLFPKNILEHEIKQLQIISKKHLIELVEVDDLVNTLGNSICVGEAEFIHSNEFNKKTVDFLKKKLKKKSVSLNDTKFSLAGALIRYCNKSYFVSQEINETDIKDFEKKIKASGTVNSGSPFVSSGLLINKNGVLIGNSCSTIEIQNICDWAE